MDQKFIYIVMGQTGEYSDHTDWAIMAYLDEKEADLHCDNATQWAYKNYKNRNKFHLKDENGNYIYKNPYDDQMDMQYTGTDYFVMKVPLKAS